MPPRKKNENEPAEPVKCDPNDCPVVRILLEYFQGKYGNDAKPQIVKDLIALKGKE